MQFANPFLKPVDAKLYPEYPLKISNPMDFTTIKARMDAGAYLHNMDAFMADMNLLFDNAFIYNLPGQPVHSWALTLKASQVYTPGTPLALEHSTSCHRIGHLFVVSGVL